MFKNIDVIRFFDVRLTVWLAKFIEKNTVAIALVAAALSIGLTFSYHFATMSPSSPATHAYLESGSAASAIFQAGLAAFALTLFLIIPKLSKSFGKIIYASIAGCLGTLVMLAVVEGALVRSAVQFNIILWAAIVGALSGIVLSYLFVKAFEFQLTLLEKKD